jgi:hypothetical protein
MKPFQTYLHLALFSWLAACGTTENLVGSMTKTALSDLTNGEEKTAPPTMEQVKQALTPELLAQAPGGVIIAYAPKVQAMGILEERGTNGDVTTYATVDNTQISLRNGLLVASRGLGFDLMSADVTGPMHAIQSGGQGTDVVRVQSHLDGENLTKFTTFSCAYSKAPDDAISEKCTSDTYGIENFYWLNSSGDVVKSQQWLSPQIGYVLIDQVKG